VILFRSIQLRSLRHGLAMNLVDWLRTSADERVLSGRRAVVICVMGCLRGLVVLDPSFLLNSHFDHSRAWIPACSRTAALLHRWRGIGAAGRGYNAVLALEVRNVVDCVERKRSAKLPWSATAPCTFAAAPSFQACLRVFIYTFCMCVFIYVYVCMCSDMYICIYMHVCVCLYIYACMCMCMHVCA